MDENLDQLRIDAGKTVEAIGRMLQRERTLDLEDLTQLAQALAYSTEVVQKLVKATAFKYV